VAFTQLFHDAKVGSDLSGIRVVAAYSVGSPDIEESDRELPKWMKAIEKLDVKLVDSVATLLRQVDSVLVMSSTARRTWSR
jgi:hypothetical protein